MRISDWSSDVCSSDLQETSFLYGLNETYIAELYKRYLDSPDSVDASWSDFFERLNEGEQAILDDMRGASWAPRQTSVVGGNGDAPSLSDATAGIRQAPPSQIQMGGRAKNGRASWRERVCQYV